MVGPFPFGADLWRGPQRFWFFRSFRCARVLQIWRFKACTASAAAGVTLRLFKLLLMCPSRSHDDEGLTES